MKRGTCILVALLLAAAGPLYGQGKVLSQAGKEFLRSSYKKASFSVGKIRVKLPPPVMNKHGKDLFLSHLSFQLDAQLFPRACVKNNARMTLSLKRFAQNYEKFSRQAPAVASLIKSRVVKGALPYGEFLPKELNTLYIGEVHDIPGLANEVRSLVRMLPQLYPNRPIYLATEFLPADEETPFSLGSVITNPRDIARRLKGVKRHTTPVLYEALKAGIGVVGLEEEYALFKKVWQETHTSPSEQMYMDYATSFVGMRFRNQAWARRLRALRAAQPDALIVVYAGFGHLGYHYDSNLPRLLGKEAFVMLFTTPDYLSYNNPFFRYFRESDDILAQFRSSQKAKLVESWKKDTPLKKIMGADMAVILHSK